MFKRLRIVFLLYVLLFVAAGQWLTAQRSTDWDATLWVDVYPVNGDGHSATQRYLDNLGAAEFSDIDSFFAAEAHRYGTTLDQPFRLNVAHEFKGEIPALPRDASMLDTLSWSLRMRWLAASLRWHSDGPSPDIIVLAVFHEAADGAALDRSTALQKGLVAVANLFADRAARGSNQVVLAHELLHTLGATDKYDLGGNQPRFPDGFADPLASPRLPQTKAELMAGRIPLDATHAVIPDNLRQVVVGALSAAEIGWQRR